MTDLGNNIFGGFRFSLQSAIVAPTHPPGSPEAKKAKEKVFVLGTNWHIVPPGPQSRGDDSYAELMADAQFPKKKLSMHASWNPAQEVVTGATSYHATKNLTTTCNFQCLPPQVAAFHGGSTSLVGEAVYKGSDYQVELSSRNLPQAIHTLSYNQSVSRGVSLGCKLTHVYPNVATSFLACYNTQRRKRDSRVGDIFALSFDPTRELELGYIRRVDKELSLGTHFSFQLQSHESVVSCGAQYNYQTFMAAMTVNSKWRVQSVFNFPLWSVAHGMLCFEIDHLTGENQVGVGVQLG